MGVPLKDSFDEVNRGGESTVMADGGPGVYRKEESQHRHSFIHFLLPECGCSLASCRKPPAGRTYPAMTDCTLKL